MNAPQDRGRFRRHPGSRKRPSRRGQVDPKARLETELTQRPASTSPQTFNVVPVTARQYAFVILNEARRTGQFVDEILERQTGIEDLSTADRRFLTELVNGVTRRTRTLDAILSKFVTRPQEKVEPALWTLLSIGAYQLVLMTGVGSHAAVNETVLLAGWLDEPRWKGFLNGVLRSIGRDVTDDYSDEPARNCVPVVTHAGNEGDTGEAVRLRQLRQDVLPDPGLWTTWLAAAYGLPAWLLYRWGHRFSDAELHNVAQWFEQRSPLTLRVNPLKGTRGELLAVLNAAMPTDGGNDPKFAAGNRPASIRVSGSVRVTELPGFADGWLTVQDETAMSAAELLAPQPGQSVLDLCAAPGGKTTHIAELMQNTGKVLAADSDANRLRRVYENSERLGLDIIEPLHVDDDSRDLPITLFDAVLVDVPCSNTGVIGKRPEVRTRLQERDIADFAMKQLALLRSAASRVRPGGRLVYSTCSIEAQENTGVVNSLLESTTDFVLEEVRELVPGQPSDGGFQALLVRSA